MNKLHMVARSERSQHHTQKHTIIKEEEGEDALFFSINVFSAKRWNISAQYHTCVMEIFF